MQLQKGCATVLAAPSSDLLSLVIQYLLLHDQRHRTVIPMDGFLCPFSLAEERALKKPGCVFCQ